MATIKNTSYKVQSDVNTEEERLYYKIEEGAHVTTSAGVWTVWNGEWVRLYPQSGSGTGLGWARYDDGTYTSSNKLTIPLDTEITLPNDAATVYRSYDGVDYYNGTTNRVLADNLNDVYLMTVVLKASAPNANQTFLRLQLDAENGTPYRRVGADIAFPKGNDAEHDEHFIVQYYADQNFVDNGSTWKMTAVGGSVDVWDIIFFIQKTQSYA